MPLWAPTDYGREMGYYGSRALGAAAGAAGAIVANRVANSAVGRITGPQVARGFLRNSPAMLMYRGIRSINRMRTGGIAPWTVRSNTGPLNMIDNQVSATQMPLLPGTIGFALLNGTVPGDLIQNRHGRAIKLSSCFLNIIVTPDSATTVANYRIFLVYDTQANGTLPLFSDVFAASDATAPANGTIACQMPRNPSNMDRFKVLWDYVGRQDGNSTQYQGPVHQRNVLKKYIKLKGLETRYNIGVAGTIGDIQTGSLLLCYGCDTNTLNSIPRINVVARLNFVP